MKRTKIIATYGPAIATKAKISQLVSAGVNLFRINCSHGTTDDFVKAVNILKEGTKDTTYPIGILFDISGPKLRLGRFEGKIAISAGQTITLTDKTTNVAEKMVAVNHPAIIHSIKKSEKVYIDDGNIMFEAVSVSRQKVVLKAHNSGIILPGKGINLPESDIKLPTITSKDKEDIKTAVRVKADFIALSFVRTGDDIIEARQIIKSFGGDQQIIAKLEKKEAIANLENIILLSDGAMIARGDLGVEIPFEELPLLQKKIIKMANIQHKPVIVATQMMESMRFSTRPTRAEVNDVASAVFDCVDAVMLSAETATGKYPLKVVSAMDKVIEATEKNLKPVEVEVESHLIRSEITHAIARGVKSTSQEQLTKVIFAFTSSGFTAVLISNLFPQEPVIALTSSERVMRKLTLHRSVYAVKAGQPKSFDDLIDTVKKVTKDYKLASSRDKVIITGGVPFGFKVPTNFMMLYEIAKKND